MVQESSIDGITRSHPLSILYFFGQAKNLDGLIEMNVIELNDWFHGELSRILSGYLFALTRIANGAENINFKKIEGYDKLGEIK
jgi:hypothetical protein